MRLRATACARAIGNGARTLETTRSTNLTRGTQELEGRFACVRDTLVAKPLHAPNAGGFYVFACVWLWIRLIDCWMASDDDDDDDDDDGRYE